MWKNNMAAVQKFFLAEDMMALANIIGARPVKLSMGIEYKHT
jgi:hypothetical protein